MQKSVVLAVSVALLLGTVGWIVLSGGGSSDAAAGVADRAADAPAVPGMPATLSAAAGPSAPADRPEAAGVDAPEGRRNLATLDAEAEAEEEPTGPLYRGRVVDEVGRPVAGAEVKLSALDAGRAQGMLGVLGNIITPSKSAETDEMGRFAVASPGGSTVDVEIGADGFRPFELEDLDLPESVATPFEDFVLDRGVVLYGAVTDDRGVPIEGAELFLVDPDRGFDFNFGPGGNSADGSTDAEGRFEFARLDPGRWAIRVQSDGHPTRLFRGTADTPGRIPAPLTLEVPVGATITGVVTGAPVDKREDLRVVAVPEGGNQWTARASGGSTESEVDEQGQFRLAGLDPDKEYELELLEKGRGSFAMMGGGASRSESVAALPGADGIELLYRQPAVVRFRVQDASTDAPLEEFTATLGLVFNQRRLTDAEGEEITFHKDGEVVFDDLFPSDFQMWGGEDSVRLQVRADGYAVASKQIEELEEGASIDLGVIEVKPAPPIRVLVTDLESGEPLRNARIRLTPSPAVDDDGDWDMDWMERMDLANSVKKAKTDSDGRAEIGSIPDMPCTLEVDRAGYAPEYLYDLVVTTVPQEFEFALGEGGEVEVFAVDQSGERQSGVIVERRNADEDDASGIRNTSKRKGARFRNLEPGRHLFRIAEVENEERNNWRPRRAFRIGDDDDEDWVAVDVAHGSELELTLEVRAASALFGRVREAGQTMARAEVSVDRVDEDESLDERMAQVAEGGRRWAEERTDTDSDGEFRMEGLQPGTYVVTVDHESRSLPWVSSFELGQGETEVTFDLPLCAVEGRVVDGDGRGIAGVEVRVLPESQRFRAPERDSGRGRFLRSGGVEVVELGAVSGGVVSSGDEVGLTDDSGNFRLEGLTPGVELVARVDGDMIVPAVSAAFTLDEDEVKTGVRLVTEQGGTIVVEPLITTDEGTSDFRWFQVTASPEDAGEEPTPTAAVDGAAEAEPASTLAVRDVTGFSFGSGPVTLTGLAPGRWTLSGSQSSPRGGLDDREGELEVEVLPGETVTVELVLE